MIALSGVVLMHAERGLKVLQSAKGGHVMVYGTPEERKHKYISWQNRINDLHYENPGLRHWRLCEIVAAEAGVNARTVYRHTTLTY